MNQAAPFVGAWTLRKPHACAYTAWVLLAFACLASSIVVLPASRFLPLRS